MHWNALKSIFCVTKLQVKFRKIYLPFKLWHKATKHNEGIEFKRPHKRRRTPTSPALSLHCHHRRRLQIAIVLLLWGENWRRGRVAAAPILYFMQELARPYSETGGGKTIGSCDWRRRRKHDHRPQFAKLSKTTGPWEWRRRNKRVELDFDKTFKKRLGFLCVTSCLLSWIDAKSFMQIKRLRLFFTYVNFPIFK